MASELLDALWQLHRNPGGEPAQALLTATLDIDEGQALQLQLLERWLNEGETLGGWKIGMTSGASRNAMGDGIRPFGFVRTSRIKTDGDRLPLGNLYHGGVENELCFEIGKHLGAGTRRSDSPTLQGDTCNSSRQCPKHAPVILLFHFLFVHLS